MDVLDMTEHLEDRHFYILDDHLSAKATPSSPGWFSRRCGAKNKNISKEGLPHRSAREGSMEILKDLWMFLRNGKNGGSCP